jgi:hypothetical protein
LAAGLAAVAADLVDVGDLLTAVWGGMALTLAHSVLRTADEAEPSGSDDEE